MTESYFQVVLHVMYLNPFSACLCVCTLVCFVFIARCKGVEWIGRHVVNLLLKGMPAAHQIALLSGVHEGGMDERSVTEDRYENTPSSTLWAALTTLVTGSFDWNILLSVFLLQTESR